jgi:uncharacterized cupredoxin-like copper-binding protein
MRLEEICVMASTRSVLRQFFIVLATAIGVLAITAACGGSSNSKSSSGNTVTVGETEWSITVSGTVLTKGQGNASVPSGAVTFNIKNDGTVDHEFEIQGNGIDQKTGTITPGQSTTLKVNLTAGKYEVWCPVPGHKELGMDGFVTAS